MNMEATRVKELIKAEFGSLSEFCKVTGRDRYELQLFFANCNRKMTVEREQELAVLEDEALRNADRPYFIDASLQMKMRMAVRRYGGARKFTDDNPEFTTNVVYQIMNKAKRRTDKVNLFLRKLNIDE